MSKLFDFSCIYNFEELVGFCADLLIKQICGESICSMDCLIVLHYFSGFFVGYNFSALMCVLWYFCDMWIYVTLYLLRQDLVRHKIICEKWEQLFSETGLIPNFARLECLHFAKTIIESRNLYIKFLCFIFFFIGSWLFSNPR